MTDTGPRIQRNFSLDREHVWWLEEQAEKEGHGNASRVLQRVIDIEATRREGFDWREQLRERKQAA